MTEQELLYASEEDIAFFNKCTEGLPKQEGENNDGIGADGVPLPFSCGAHSVRCLREIIDIVKPEDILEIGFNIGRSSALWLNISSANVLSIDISDKNETLDAALKLHSKFPNRFNFAFRKNNPAYIGFSLIFIDGGHEYNDVLEDITLAIEHQIPYIAFDDILPQYGPGVMPAIREFPELELVKEMGNIALYKNTRA